MTPSSLLDAVRRDGDPYLALAQHREALRRLEDVAEAYLARGEYDDAVGTVDAAAKLAELNHPGVLASPRLEAVLEAISRDKLPAAGAVRRPRTRNGVGKERVLLVATETYESGGHTRILWRWVARDPDRVYSVATTAQRGVMPDGIRAAVAASGGELLDIPADAPPLQRAAALRALAAEADLIVLVDHPYDPIPMLALSGLPDRPPIVMFNHGDHLLWIGRGVVDVLMCIRREGVRLAGLRGLPPRRVLATPFPVYGPDGHGRDAREPLDPIVRAQARERVLSSLGWPGDTVLLVTVGTHHKWEGPPGHRLLDLVEPTLAHHPQARVVAAGALADGQWNEMRRRTGGRVMAAGVLPHGVGELLSAADIYLDSRPIGGMGAPAEAAAHALPVLTGQATELELATFAADPAYGATCIVGNDAYREMLMRLLADPELRRDLGERARLTLAAADEAWEPAVERTYALARELGPIQRHELAPLPEPDDHDALIDWATAFRGRAPAALASIVRLRELIAQNPGLRQLYAPLEHRAFRQVARFPAAFAAPPADAERLTAAVAQLRVLSQLGIAERFMIALRPGDAEQSIPVLEAALAQGPDFELELTIDPDPARVRPEHALVLA